MLDALPLETPRTKVKRFENCLRSGYELLDDGSCVDIDECINLTPKCQNNCTNFDGGYRCECPDGQALKQDGRNCGNCASMLHDGMFLLVRGST